MLRLRARRRFVETVPECDIEHSVRPEREPRAEMQTVIVCRQRSKYDANLLEIAAIFRKRAACDACAAAPFALLREAPKYSPVFGEIRAQRNVEKAPLPASGYRGQTALPARRRNAALPDRQHACDRL